MTARSPDHFPIAEDFDRMPFTAVDELLNAGIPAYFADPRFPEGYVRANPNGTRTLIRFNGEDWEDVREL